MDVIQNNLMKITQYGHFSFHLTLVCSLFVGSVFSATAQEQFELKDGQFQPITQLDPDSPEGKLQAIRKAVADGQGSAADKLAKQWIADYPNHPNADEAYLLRARAMIIEQEYFKSLYQLEYLLRSYTDSKFFNAALEEEYRIAMAFGNGMKRKLWGMRIVSAEAEAEELFIRIQERAPGSDVAEKAGIALADYYYRTSEMKLAAEAYELFLANYPDSQWRERAMLRMISANLATFKGPQFDITGLEEAKARLRDFKAEFPAGAEKLGSDALLVRIDESIAESSLITGYWYEDQKKTRSAIYVYKRLISDHPRSAAARKALARLKVLAPRLFADVKSNSNNAGVQP